MTGRRGGAVALIVALLVVGGLATIQPRGLGNAWHSATAPDTADAGDFRVTIVDPTEDVIIVRAVSHGYKSYTTDHRLVLARVRYEFVRTGATINDVRLVSRDGYVYESLSDYDVAPGRRRGRPPPSWTRTRPRPAPRTSFRARWAHRAASGAISSSPPTASTTTPTSWWSCPASPPGRSPSPAPDRGREPQPAGPGRSPARIGPW